MIFHIVIICLKELSEVLHSQLYSFVLLLPPPPVCFIFSNMTLHSLPVKVVTVLREVRNAFFENLNVVLYLLGLTDDSRKGLI